MSLAIDPETTVGALLEAYPEVESVLDMAPAFANHNAVVRHHGQGGDAGAGGQENGGVKPQAVVLRLRDVTAQSGPDLPVIPTRPVGGDDASWPTGGHVVEEMDADAMLERGVHPWGRSARR